MRIFPSWILRVWRRNLTGSLQASTPPVVGKMSLSVTGILKVAVLVVDWFWVILLICGRSMLLMS